MAAYHDKAGAKMLSKHSKSARASEADLPASDLGREFVLASSGKFSAPGSPGGWRSTANIPLAVDDAGGLLACETTKGFASQAEATADLDTRSLEDSFVGGRCYASDKSGAPYATQVFHARSPGELAPPGSRSVVVPLSRRAELMAGCDVGAGGPADLAVNAEAAVNCVGFGFDMKVTASGKRWTDGEEADFQYMPSGVHTICPTWNGRPIQLTVQCDERTAAVCQASLDSWRERQPKQTPFMCVEHREEEAAGRVLGFSYKTEPEPGVFCRTVPTPLGARNVNGRIHESFSPSFTTDAEYGKCRVACCNQRVAACRCATPGAASFPDGAKGSASNPASITGVAFSVGSLTNKPAFHQILPVLAKEASAASQT